MIYELEKFILQAVDYMICRMQEMISQAVYDIQQTMKQQQLDGFNGAVQGVVQQVCCVAAVVAAAVVPEPPLPRPSLAPLACRRPSTQHCSAAHTLHTNTYAAKQKVQNRCGAWNCLNFTNIEPSRRNAAANSNCMYYGLPSPPGACAGVTWDPKAPTPCVTYTYFGEPRNGVCDPNGYCYYSGARRG